MNKREKYKVIKRKEGKMKEVKRKNGRGRKEEKGRMKAVYIWKKKIGGKNV